MPAGTSGNQALQFAELPGYAMMRSSTLSCLLIAESAVSGKIGILLMQDLYAIHRLGR